MSQVGTLRLLQTQSWLMVATPHLSTGCLVGITLQSLITSLVLKNKPNKDFLFVFFFFFLVLRMFPQDVRLEYFFDFSRTALYFFLNFYWSIVPSQCFVSFYCTAK